MVRRAGAALGVVVLACLVPTAAWPFDYARYQPRTIRALVGEYPARSGLVITRDIPIRAKVRYTGEFRDLPAASRRVIDAWAEAMNVPGTPATFRLELKVVESGTGYWLPVQTTLVPIMMAELQASEEIEVYLIYVGQIDGRHLLLVNAFDHEGHPH